MGNTANSSVTYLVWSCCLAVLACRPCFAARTLLQNQTVSLKQAFQDFTAPLLLNYTGAAEPTLAPASAPGLAPYSAPRRQLLSTSTGEILLQSISNSGCDFYGGCLGYVTFSISGNTLHTSPAPDTPLQYRCNLSSGLNYAYSAGQA